MAIPVGKCTLAMIKNAFTLIELLIVLVIVAILAGAMVPMFRTSRYQTQVARAKADMETIKTASHMLHLDTGKWPANGNSGKGLVSNDNGAGTAIPGWNGPYLNDWKNDPWEKPYELILIQWGGGSNPWQKWVKSYGPDGKSSFPLYDPDDDDIPLLIAPDITQ